MEQELQKDLHRQINDHADDHTEKTVAELLSLAKHDNGGAFADLCAMYEPLICAEVSRSSARIPGAGNESDRDDLRQVALMAFYRAVCSYDSAQSGVEFGLYAKICIGNALISYLRSLGHRKHEFPMSDRMTGEATHAFDDPAAGVMEEEALEGLRARIRRSLSPYENRVWNFCTLGYSSGEIAKFLGKSTRSIENAVYRIRQKLRLLLRQ